MSFHKTMSPVSDRALLDNYSKGPRRIQRKIRHLLTQPVSLVVLALLITVAVGFIVNYAASMIAMCLRCFTGFLRQIADSSAPDVPFEFPFFFELAPVPAWVHALLLIFDVFIGVRAGWLLYKNLYLADEEESKGSRRWTTLEELKKQYRAVPDRKELFDGPGGIPVSRYQDRLFIDDGPVNNMIIGSTRSGKGEIFISSIMDIYSRSRDIKDRASMIFTDPKGELCAMGTETLRKRGYDVRAIDLIHFNGDSYNPLALIRDAYMNGDISEAQMLTRAITTVFFEDPKAMEKHWQEWAMALGNALILAHVIDCCDAAKAAKTEEEKERWLAKINMYSVARLLSDLMADENAEVYPIDIFFDNRPEDDVARLQYAAVRSAPGKTKGGIFATAFAFLSLFTMDEMAKMTASNSIDFKSIGYNEDHPTALFLLLPDYDTSNHFLATVLLSQLRFVLAKQASRTPGGKCVRRVIFVLDEYGNLKPLPDMSKNITTDLGRGIYYNIIVQAYSQIFKQHGADDGKTIIGNCGNQIYLLTAEYATAQQFSELIGTKTITVQSSTGDELSTFKTFSEHIDQKPLLNANQLMELKEGECVIVRVAKRRDLKGKKITATPIFATGETAMKYRYEYLYEDFDNSRSLADVHFESPHKKLNLRDLTYTPFVFDDMGFELDGVEQAQTEDTAITPQGKEKLSELPTLREIVGVYSQLAENEGFRAKTIDMVEDMTFGDLQAHLEDELDMGHMTIAEYQRILSLADSGVKQYARERSAAADHEQEQNEQQNSASVEEEMP